MKRSRRAFLGAGLWAVLISRRPVAASAQALSAAPLDAVSLATLEAVADTIVPRDRDPGALDAAVPARILARLAIDPAALSLYRSGLELLDRVARQESAPSFRALDAAGRERILSSLLNGSHGAQPLAEQFFLRARRDVLAFYWGSVIGQGVVDYRPPLAGYPEYADPPPRARSPQR